MRTYYKYFFIFFLLIISGCTYTKKYDNNIDNDLVAPELKGKVKQISNFKYEAVDKFGKIEKGEIIQDSSYHYGNNYIIKFNEKGDEIEINNYNSNSEGSLFYKVINKYDETGNRIEENWYKSDGSLDRKYIYKYDEKGNIIEEKKYYSDGNMAWGYSDKYNEKGKKIKRKFYDKHNGSLSSKGTYSYNEKGNMIEFKVYEPDGSLSFKSTFRYDEKGNRIEENVYKSDGSLLQKITYKYNEKGNRIEENVYKSDRSLDFKITLKYKFDKMGNWIKKIEFKNTFPQYIVEKKLNIINSDNVALR